MPESKDLSGTQTPQATTIIHLRDPEGISRFYHSLDKSERFLGLHGESVIEGRYGAEPAAAALREFRNTLYTQIRRAVFSAAAERLFIPRFLTSSFVFLLTFLFLSLVIRDPIPIVDEIIISFGTGLFSWVIFMRRRFGKTDEAEKELILRDKLDQTYFQPDDSLRRVESLWSEYFINSPQQRINEFIPWLIACAAVYESGKSVSKEFARIIQDGVRVKIGKRVERAAARVLFKTARGEHISKLERTRLARWMNPMIDKDTARAVCLLAAVEFLS